MKELINLIEIVTKDNLVLTELTKKYIDVLHGDNNEELNTISKQIREEMIKRNENNIKFRDYMAKYNLTKVDQIIKPEDINETEFNNIIDSFKKSVIEGKDILEICFKEFSAEYNMINKIQHLGRKSKLDIKI